MPLQGLPVLYWGGGGETKLARLPGWRLEVGVVVIGVATIADMNNFPSLSSFPFLHLPTLSLFLLLLGRRL